MKNVGYWIVAIVWLALMINAIACAQYWHTNIADMPGRCALIR